MSKLLAIILARGGSKGIKKKNLKKVNNITLIERSILSLQKAKKVSDIIVSSDSTEILNISKKLGAKTLKRPKKLSTDKSSSELGWLDVLSRLNEIDVKETNYCILVQCTSPFLYPEDLDSGIRKIQRTKADVCFSSVPFKYFIWRENSNNSLSGVNHSENKGRLLRQMLFPSQYLETGAFLILNTKKFKKTKKRFFGSITHVNVKNPAIEIDNLYDLQIANMLSKKFESI